MSEKNKEAYNSEKVAKNYSEKLFLFKGENHLIEKFKNNSNNGKMLDVGIGTGRTTYFFAKYFNEYVGIDYAAQMIKIAKEKFKNKNNCSFYELDATNMSIFNDNEFDFVFFSFNGLDCVSLEKRIKILKEIKRVAKKGAIFSYSTHNIFNIPKLFKFRMPRNPLNLMAEIKRYKKINTINENPESLIKKDFDIITDGDINFTVQYYYCNINYEINTIKKLAFNPFEFYSLKTGEKYNENTKWDNIDTPWILINSYVNE